MERCRSTAGRVDVIDPEIHAPARLRRGAIRVGRDWSHDAHHVAGTGCMPVLRSPGC
jgi:hypothetical protein